MITARHTATLLITLLTAAPLWSADPSQGEPATVALLPFDNLSGQQKSARTSSGASYRERLRVDAYGELCRQTIEEILVGRAGIVVLERDRIDRALEEIEFANSALVDQQQNQVRLGAMLSSNYLISGAILPVEFEKSELRSYRINRKTTSLRVTVRIKILEVNQGRIIYSRSFEGSDEVQSSKFNRRDKSLLTPALKDALGKIANDPKLRRALATMGGRSQGPSVLLRFEPTPEGCDLEIDGLFQGNTPIETEIPVGALIKVRISRPGYEPWEKSIKVSDKLAARPIKPVLVKQSERS